LERKAVKLRQMNRGKLEAVVEVSHPKGPILLDACSDLVTGISIFMPLFTFHGIRPLSFNRT